MSLSRSSGRIFAISSGQGKLPNLDRICTRRRIFTKRPFSCLLTSTHRGSLIRSISSSRQILPVSSISFLNPPSTESLQGLQAKTFGWRISFRLALTIDLRTHYSMASSKSISTSSCISLIKSEFLPVLEVVYLPFRCAGSTVRVSYLVDWRHIHFAARCYILYDLFVTIAHMYSSHIINIVSLQVYIQVSTHLRSNYTHISSFHRVNRNSGWRSPIGALVFPACQRVSYASMLLWRRPSLRALFSHMQYDLFNIVRPI